MIKYCRLPKEMIHHKESKLIKQLLDEAEKRIRELEGRDGKFMHNSA